MRVSHTLRHKRTMKNFQLGLMEGGNQPSYCGEKKRRQIEETIEERSKDWHSSAYLTKARCLCVFLCVCMHACVCVYDAVGVVGLTPAVIQLDEELNQGMTKAIVALEFFSTIVCTKVHVMQ